MKPTTDIIVCAFSNLSDVVWRSCFFLSSVRFPFFPSLLSPISLDSQADLKIDPVNRAKKANHKCCAQMTLFI